MNANDLSEEGLKKARIEIIPLIDVIFFLLATFVLFTLSLSKMASLGITLPKSGPPSGEDQTVYLQASDEGTFYWKQGRLAVPELISAREVGPRLADYKQHTADPRVFIRGDSKAKFGAAVWALDEVRHAGIEKVSFETTVSKPGN